MISIDINSTEVQKQLAALAIATHYRAPLMRSIAGTMHAAVMENFQRGGRPKWLGIKHREGVPLNDTGTLRKSINQSYDSSHAVVGVPNGKKAANYAAIHQFGGKTRPHVIKPVTAKALRFNGRFAKSVNHPGSKIPARPFLTLTEQDKADIVDDVQKYLQNVID
ncbi:MAG: phage virion morphogenesis protein [Gammaproteobacteria bacterium]|nr:phage virion morphogenesis protein [Gammaproteobacteria bacterium]